MSAGDKRRRSLDGRDQPASKRAATTVQPSKVSLMMMAGAASDPGKKRVYEDRWLIDDERRLVAVFDGHGGDEVSDYLRSHLVDVFDAERSKAPTLKAAIIAIFQTLDVDVISL